MYATYFNFSNVNLIGLFIGQTWKSTGISHKLLYGLSSRKFVKWFPWKATMCEFPRAAIIKHLEQHTFMSPVLQAGPQGPGVSRAGPPEPPPWVCGCCLLLGSSRGHPSVPAMFSSPFPLRSPVTWDLGPAYDIIVPKSPL